MSSPSSTATAIAEPTPAFVPVQTRSERFTSYDVADFGPVTGREIEWKYTPIAPIGALIDGALDGTRPPTETSGDSGITFEWVDRSDKRIGASGTPEDRVSANAWSSFTDALVVTVSGEEAVRGTISRETLGAKPRAAHTVIVAEKHSNGTIVLENTGDAMLGENVEIILEDNAHLTVVTVQEWADDGIQLASHFARIGRDATLKHVVVSLGGSIVRVNSTARLVGEGGAVELYGLYFADAGQHLEQHIFVDHDAPHTNSRVSYKGALQGDGAHTVWVGDVLIRSSASGTDSYEENRNLLLTDGTRADSVPNLEIETGDIAGAGHASTSGRFDDEQLFYLRSRGIPEYDARRLVVRGFLSGIVQKIGIPDVQERLETAIESELRRSKAD